MKTLRPRLVSLMILGLLCAWSGNVPSHTVHAAEQQTHLLTPQELESTFPASVYFHGKTAPVQTRNAAAVRFADGAVFFAGLVDSSGYATNIQETYQIYLLSEQPVLFGGKPLPSGAYGAGFIGTRFVVLDLGGHTVAEGDTTLDETLTRPRPLQLLQPAEQTVRLYLGRRWVSIALASTK